MLTVVIHELEVNRDYQFKVTDHIPSTWLSSRALNVFDIYEIFLTSTDSCRRNNTFYDSIIISQFDEAQMKLRLPGTWTSDFDCTLVYGSEVYA